VLSALVKAVRTFVQAFCGVMAVSVPADFSVPAWRAVVLAAAAAALAAAWRAGLDTLPVPSLVDRWGTAAVPGAEPPRLPRRA